MDSLPIGVSTTVTFSFKGNPTFPVAPTYNVVRQDDTILLSGIATVSGSMSGGWDANVSIPTTFLTATGGETVVVELIGVDSTGRTRSTEREFRLIDATDDWSPNGILTRPGYDFSDTIILDNANYLSADIGVEIYDMFDTAVLTTVNPTIDDIKRVADRNTLPDRFSTPKFNGYRYSLTIPAASVTYPTLTRAAYQVRYTVMAGTVIKKFEAHPLYRLNSRWINALNSLRQFLDKARLYEIDKSLQWQDDELCQSLIEGMAYINSFPSTMTYYTVDDCPQSLTLPLWYAAAFHALNARYLAEGFTAFEFSGLTSNLTVDRRDTITYKIEELKDYLTTNLTKIKSAVIATVGAGTPADATTVTARPLGVLGLTVGPHNNVYNPWRLGRTNFNRG